MLSWIKAQDKINVWAYVSQQEHPMPRCNNKKTDLIRAEPVGPVVRFLRERMLDQAGLRLKHVRGTRPLTARSCI